MSGTPPTTMREEPLSTMLISDEGSGPSSAGLPASAGMEGGLAATVAHVTGFAMPDIERCRGAARACAQLRRGLVIVDIVALPSARCRRQRLEIFGDGREIRIREVLRARIDDLGHRAEHHAMLIAA